MYVAMLRGINVGGRNKMAMEDLRELIQCLGGREVSTYIQSGNAVFATSVSQAKGLARRLEKEISSQYGFAVTVVLRTGSQMQQVVVDNPYAGDRKFDARHLHVTFLAGVSEKGALAVPESGGAGAGEFVVRKQEIYLHCPGGYGRTRYNNAYFERRYCVPVTTRNWNTVQVLAEMANPA